jgi:hypothetical protein
MQREKLKKQKLTKKNTETFARGLKKMLFESKGGPIKKVQSTKDALSRKRRASVKRTKAAVGSKGSSVTTKGPAKKVGRLAAGARAYAAQSAGLYLADKMAQTIGKKGQSKMSRLGIKGGAVKSKPAAAKPKMKPSPGMSKGAVEAAKKGAAAANKASATPKKKVSKVSAPKATKKAPVSAPRSVSSTSKPRTSAPKAKSSGGKNPYRMPQGAERKDRMSKVVKELKAMKLSSKKRQEAQKPKKKMSRNESNLRRRQGR